MTDELKNWVENGENAVFGNRLFHKHFGNNYLFRTSGAALVNHPLFGLWAFTEYGAIFRVPSGIKDVYQPERPGDKLYIFTHYGLLFIYDMRTGQLEEIVEE